MAPKKDAVAKLQELADEIGGAGAAADTQESQMAKAMREGFAGMHAALTDGLRMLKGGKGGDMPPPPAKKPAADADDDDEGEGDDDDADDVPPPKKPADDADDDDDDAGYSDMRMGSDGDELVDATPLLLEINKRLGRAERANADLQAENQRMHKALKRTNRLLEQVLVSQLATAQPLMKGIAAIGDSLAAVPAGSIVPPRAAPPRKVTGKLGTLDERGQKLLMLKAQRAGMINEFDVQRFLTGGRFKDNETDNAAVTSRVESLIEGA